MLKLSRRARRVRPGLAFRSPLESLSASAAASAMRSRVRSVASFARASWRKLRRSPQPGWCLAFALVCLKRSTRSGETLPPGPATLGKQRCRRRPNEHAQSRARARRLQRGAERRAPAALPLRVHSLVLNALHLAFILTLLIRVYSPSPSSPTSSSRARRSLSASSARRRSASSSRFAKAATRRHTRRSKRGDAANCR